MLIKPFQKGVSRNSVPPWHIDCLLTGLVFDIETALMAEDRLLYTLADICEW